MACARQNFQLVLYLVLAVSIPILFMHMALTPRERWCQFCLDEYSPLNVKRLVTFKDSETKVVWNRFSKYFRARL